MVLQKVPQELVIQEDLVVEVDQVVVLLVQEEQEIHLL